MADAGMLAGGHARHDGVVIASTVDRRLPTPSSLALALLAACTECARLHADLLALAAALPSAATPRRTRDFTLSAADAERLRPRGLMRWLRLIGSSRDTITRPLALGFTTLGLAGLLVATIPGALPGSGAGAATAGASAGPDLEMHVVASPDGGLQQQAPERGDGAARVPATDAGIPPVIILSSAFLLTGGALLTARRVVPRRDGRHGRGRIIR